MTPVFALDPAERIILALDRPDAAAALALAAAIPGLRWVKVGLELFTAAGPVVVSELRQRGLRLEQRLAPFLPEGGAYAAIGHSHSHSHGHGHGHGPEASHRHGSEATHSQSPA